MDDSDHTLCHVTTHQTIATANGRLSGTPFLHCCTEAQLAFVLDRHFGGRANLVVLRFDRSAIDGRIEWERSEPAQDPFPHLFGELNLASVVTERV